jgi:hypothetical protein
LRIALSQERPIKHAESDTFQIKGMTGTSVTAKIEEKTSEGVKCLKLDQFDTLYPSVLAHSN